MEHHTLGCVIFDLDGTLLDSMNVWSQIDRNLLNHYGKTAPDDLTEQVKKMTIQQSAQADAYRNTLQLKSGVFPLLDWLDARNVPYCVATATYPDLAEAALKRLQVWERIAFLMTEQEVGVGKSQPTIYRQAASRMGCGKRQTVVVEDAVHAIETAATDGFFTVGVYEPTLSEMDWNTIQARATVSVKDLQKLLAEIQSGRIPL